MINKPLTPRYEHDCDECKLLGMFGDFDLYLSTTCNSGIKTIVARYGDEGSHYTSGWNIPHPALRIGQIMAVELESMNENLSN